MFHCIVINGVCTSNKSCKTFLASLLNMMVKQLVMLDTEFFTLFVQGRGKRPSHLLYEISYIVINDTSINQYNYYFQDLVHGGKVISGLKTKVKGDYYC